jgi:hypothetical protein
MILLSWDDRERAWLYAQSDDSRQVLTQAGSVGPPDVWILDNDGG